MRACVLSADGHTILIYQDGKLVDEEPVECHLSPTQAAEPARDLTPCACGITRTDCEYHHA